MQEDEKDASVFLIDDDAELRESLSGLLQLTGLSVEPFHSVAKFRSQVDTRRPGCLILDLRMPEMSGLEVQRSLAQVEVPWPVIFISGFADTQVVVEAMKLGAIDFFVKPVHEQSLLDCISRALKIDQENRATLKEKQDLESRLSNLSENELQVLEMIIQGRLNKQIAAKFGVSLRTIENRRASILRKLGMNSVLEVIWHIGRLNINIEQLFSVTCDPPHRLQAPHFSTAKKIQFAESEDS